MARQLPKKRNPKQSLIIKAVRDYYGNGATTKEIADSKVIALFLMGRKARLQPMDDEQKSAMWDVSTNLKDSIYTFNL